MKKLFDLVRSSVSSLIPASPESLIAQAPPVILGAFNRVDGNVLKGWYVVTDGNSELEGSSTATVDLVEESCVGESKDRSEPTRFARFSGNLSKQVVGHREKVRTGFAALRSEKWDPPVSLAEMDVVELKMKSDGRTYALNLNVDSFNEEDIYQGVIQVPGDGHWRTLTLPLAQFALTGRGRMRQSQRSLDGDARVKSVGILLADHIDGPFQLDVASMTARSEEEGGEIHSSRPHSPNGFPLPHSKTHK